MPPRPDAKSAFGPRTDLPDTPTVGETVPGYEASALFGMAAPKNTPKEIIEKLNKEINAVLAEPGMQKPLVELGGDLLIGTLMFLSRQKLTNSRCDINRQTR